MEEKKKERSGKEKQNGEKRKSTRVGQKSKKKKKRKGREKYSATGGGYFKSLRGSPLSGKMFRENHGGRRRV